MDMGCVGEGLQCTERQVSICAKDSGGPYSYEVVGKLIDAARRTGADYAVDVYPHYGSDVEATLWAGPRPPPRAAIVRRRVSRQPRLRAQPCGRRVEHPEGAGGLSGGGRCPVTPSRPGPTLPPHA